jgi:hypothetical protein
VVLAGPGPKPGTRARHRKAPLRRSARGVRNQAAELPEPDDDEEDDEGEEEEDEEPADAPAVALLSDEPEDPDVPESPPDFSGADFAEEGAGELLDDEPRLSLR